MIKIEQLKFFKFLALHHYCEGLMIVTGLIAFIFSLRHYDRHRSLRILPYYLGLFLLQAVVAEFNLYVSPRGDRFAILFDQISTSVFTIVEFCVFNLLILHYITGGGRRMAIKLNAGLFFIVETFLCLQAFPRVPTNVMCLLEPMAIVLPGALYFYELFTIVNSNALIDRPSFWIVSGIMYLSVVSLTSMLTLEYLGRFGDGAFALGNVFYSILFVLLMRAYKCNPDEWVVA